MILLKQKRAELCDKQEELLNKALSEERAMTEEEQDQFKNFQKEIDELTQTIEAAQSIEGRGDYLDEPDGKAFRPSHVIPGGIHKEKFDDGGFKNIGEFVSAVRFGDPKGRLASLPTGEGQNGGIKVPDAFAAQIMPWRFQNEWSVGVGEEGGLMVPTQFLGGDPLMLRPEEAIVRPRATVIPAGDPPDGAISIPAFSQGSKGVFGGVTVEWIGEGDTVPETGGKLREVTLQSNEVAASTVVTDKLLRNWEAAASFVGMLLRGATLAAEDMVALIGNGVAKPLGVQNCPGALFANRAVANQISYGDIINMQTKFLPEALSRAVWVITQDALPQVAQLQDPSGRYIYIGGDATRGIPTTLNGIPVHFTGKTPALGNKGDVMLVDFTYYLIKDGSGPFVSASEHVLFRQNKTIIKIVWNVDGKGWVDEPLTLENDTAKVSPYVILDVPSV